MSHTVHFQWHYPRLRTMVGMFAAVVVLDSGLAVVAELPGGALNPQLVHVSGLAWTSGGSLLSSGSGFVARFGSDVILTLYDSNFGDTPIQYSVAISNPASFLVVNESLPPIPIGAVGVLTVTVGIPRSSYSGPLIIDLE